MQTKQAKCIFMEQEMITKSTLTNQIETEGIIIRRVVNRFATQNIDMVFPYIILTLDLQGSARALYDMREVTHHKNDLAFIMPGHIIRPLACTDDYAYTYVGISPQIFHELRFSIFSHDYDKFNYAPTCSLTDEQAQRLLAIVDQLIVIAGHSEEEMPHRHQVLLAQLAVGYEFLNCYRREQDKKWAENRNASLFNQFCDLVVEHYKESREIQYYAQLLNLTPKYFSKIIRSAAGGISPGQWIEQYVITQAKRLIETQPTLSLKEIAYMLGFSEPTSFYRYFKHATGQTAKEYRDQMSGE